MKPRQLLFAAAIAGASGVTWAQYKVVAPDGSVTYTDRPPLTSPANKVIPLGRRALPAAPSADASLPLDLRPVVARFPVTLFTAARCESCDAGRQMLVQRGIPFAERTVATESDLDALERLSGGRTVPALTIGQQPLRGFNSLDWSNYLDAAGYPRESRLPKGWVAASPQPLTAPRPVASLPPPPAVPASAPDTVSPPAASSAEGDAEGASPRPSIRF